MSENEAAPMTADELAAIAEREYRSPVVVYKQTPTLSIFRDHDNSLAELDADGNIRTWDNNVVFSDATCVLFASAKDDMRHLLVEVERLQALADATFAERLAACAPVALRAAAALLELGKLAPELIAAIDELMTGDGT